MLANAYGTNITNEAIALIISELSNLDLALILSGLLSLATDNAKELALDKLNAANMLGMYIYGITIGMDFLTLADIICSEVGLVINEMLGSNSFTLQKRMSIQNIFDYLETAPNFKPKLLLGTKLSTIGLNLIEDISLQSLYDLVHKSGLGLKEQLQFIENLKNKIDFEISLTELEKLSIHRVIEEAEDFILRANIIKNLKKIYEDFKKLNEGSDELRKQGLLLHINQGLETSYVKSINYIDTLTSAIADRQYSKYRQQKRKLEIEILEGRKSIKDRKTLKSPDGRWKFDFHNFAFSKDYREAWIDIYGGIINLEKFINSEIYRQQFEQIYPDILKIENILTKYLSALTKLYPSKVFFNILDTMLVPHFLAYLQSADMLHQAMLKTSAKYRAIFDLGKKAVDELGAFSTNDKEGIYRRTELFVDRVMRDRYFLSKSLKITIPRGLSYFLSSLDEKVRKHPEDFSITDGLTKAESKNSNTTIELGTRAGNASFKLLMETKIIPNLLEGRYGEGNNRNPALANNEFIKSLAPVLYKQTSQHNVIINYAPNINMSPRSDADKALFEKIKFEFNEFKSGHLGNIKYKLGDRQYDIIELFYYYNQIAFGGKPGENTLTSIFQDVLDYKPIKEFRDYENLFDKEGVLKVDINSIMKEVAPKANPWTSNLKHIYYEDPNTGKLSYWTKVYPKKLKFSYSGYGIEEDFSSYSINNYIPEALGFTNNEDIKNFVLNSIDSDTSSEELELSDKSKAIVSFNLGQISQIKIRPWNGTQVDILGEYLINIPEEYKQFFDNPPTTYIIDLNGNRTLGYDLNTISRYVEQLITCS